MTKPDMYQIPNQENIRRAMLNLFTKPEPVRDELTPTQRFVVSDLKDLILAKDGKGKDKFQHWELRKLKATRTILLAAIIGKQERYILIGPRGHLEQLSSKDDLAKMQLDKAIEEQHQGES